MRTMTRYTQGKQYPVTQEQPSADGSGTGLAHVVKSIDGGLVTYESDGETLEVSRDHVVSVKAEASNG